MVRSAREAVQPHARKQNERKVLEDKITICDRDHTRESRRDRGTTVSTARDRRRTRHSPHTRVSNSLDLKLNLLTQIQPQRPRRSPPIKRNPHQLIPLRNIFEQREQETVERDALVDRCL